MTTNAQVKKNDNNNDLRDSVILVGGILSAIIGTAFVIISIFQSDSFMSRAAMGFGLGLYFLGISLSINASFSHMKAFNILRNEIRALSPTDKTTPISDKEVIEGKPDLTGTDDIDKICNDYKALLNKFAMKEEICKDLRENTDKLNTALLIQLLKFHKDNERGNRDFAYSNLYLMMVTLLFSLAAVFISIGVDKIWTLGVSIFFMLIFGLLIKYWYRNRLEGK